MQKSINSSSGSVSSDTTQRSTRSVVRQLKAGFEANSSTSQTNTKTPKSINPKNVDHTAPRAPVNEQKKRLGRVAELETQVTQLDDDLRTVKNQLIVSELCKKQAKLDAQVSRKELLAVTLRLQESRRILAQSNYDDDESIQKPNSAESTALAAALLEIGKLKVKLHIATVYETKKTESAHMEINILKQNMSETLLLMDEMKNQLENNNSSKFKAQILANETLQQLETAKKTMESLKLNSDEYKAVVQKTKSTDQEIESEQESQTLEIMVELRNSKSDIKKLTANQMDKEAELQYVLEEENLNAKLTNLISGIYEHESKQDFKSLETELRKKSDENENLKMEIKKLNDFIELSKQDFNSLKSKSTNLGTELREKSNENEKLKLEIENKNGVTEASKQDYKNFKSELASLETELCKKSNENEEFKLEIEKMTKKLEYVNMSKCEIEEELKKLKVQMGQWRKAAEAATAMLCDENGDNNGQMMVDRTWSTGHFSPRKWMNLGSPCNVDIDEDNEDDNDDNEFLKRRNGNVLRRIGVLWKKPQNK